MDIIEPGTYLAKVDSHVIAKTNNGDPQAAVTFSFTADGKSRKIIWFGSFKDKALPFTLKGLINCGLVGNNPAGPLEIGREVSIVIETDKDYKGIERSKVRWVNAPGGLRNVVPQDEATAKLSALEGAVLKARQETKSSDSGDIPF